MNEIPAFGMAHRQDLISNILLLQIRLSLIKGERT